MGGARRWSPFAFVDGHYGATKLDGVTFAAAYWWPGAVHEGNGVSAARDRRARDARSAHRPLNITSGKEGCTFFEIFASVVSNTLDPMFVPIDLSSDRNARVASLKVPGLGEFRVEPIRNPVTGEEHRAHHQAAQRIRVQGSRDGELPRALRAVGDKVISNKNSYAQFAAVDWSNA